MIVDMTRMIQGSGDQQRVGDKVKPVKLDIKGRLLGGSNDTNQMRLTIIQWHPNTTTPLVAPSISDIYLYTASAGMVVNSPFQWDTRTNFTVLYDRRYTLSGSVDADNHQVDYHIVCYPKKSISYTAGSLEGMNKIFFFATSDYSSGILQPSVRYIYQLTYKDA